ncbi:FadR/GntR family transcriptional regulator [Halobacillus sp. K22]|uniref:FadR/GntR family transcriptional regulator n=1 Tax=Halobacillus sp. K22 TaxID=3457431 RepID=UPI003FCC2C0E
MTRSQQGKVYEGVLYQLKSYIDENQLTPGDKLPSERELSEQLNVGRSSIREAFRALELLGLIETKRGEGTYIRAYRPYYMVELLSSFLLNESRTREELQTAKQMLEKEALFILAGNATEEQRFKLEQIIMEENGKERYHSFFKFLFELCDRPLLLSMWQFISGFAHAVEEIQYEAVWYEQVIEIIIDGNKKDILMLYP